MLIDSILTEACQNLSRLKDNLTVFFKVKLDFTKMLVDIKLLVNLFFNHLLRKM